MTIDRQVEIYWRQKGWSGRLYKMINNHLDAIDHLKEGPCSVQSYNKISNGTYARNLFKNLLRFGVIRLTDETETIYHNGRVITVHLFQLCEMNAVEYVDYLFKLRGYSR